MSEPSVSLFIPYTMKKDDQVTLNHIFSIRLYDSGAKKRTVVMSLGIVLTMIYVYQQTAAIVNNLLSRRLTLYFGQLEEVLFWWVEFGDLVVPMSAHYGRQRIGFVQHRSLGRADFATERTHVLCSWGQALPLILHHCKRGWYYKWLNQALEMEKCNARNMSSGSWGDISVLTS